MSGSGLGNLFDIDQGAAPPVSAASAARIYFDSTKLQLMISAVGNAYQFMLADGVYWGTSTPTANSFLTPYQAAAAASELVGQFAMPRAGHLAGLFVRALNANFSASGNVTLRNNAVDTALIATFTNAVSSASDDTDLVTVARGDLVSIRCSVLLTNTPIFASVLLLP
jgi:hypothetical protein